MRVDEAEDRDVGADTDGQRQDRNGREPRTVTESATGMTEIPEQGRHQTHLPQTIRLLDGT